MFVRSELLGLDHPPQRRRIKFCLWKGRVSKHTWMYFKIALWRNLLSLALYLHWRKHSWSIFIPFLLMSLSFPGKRVTYLTDELVSRNRLCLSPLFSSHVPGCRGHRFSSTPGQMAHFSDVLCPCANSVLSMTDCMHLLRGKILKRPPGAQA